MKMNLNELEIRVLGCLMEKELTTPEYYPLTINALVSACNQKSNRDPVMSLTEADVQRGLEGLGSRGLARLTTTGGRVAKYCHSVADKFRLAVPTRAVLAELMLRGPQTVGELRNRGERMAELADLTTVEAILFELQQYGPPMVVRLPRQAGRKDQRYAQVFAGMPELPEEEEPAVERSSLERSVVERSPGERSVVERSSGESRSGGQAAGSERVAQLEEGVGTLREEIATLRQEVEELMAAFA
jgi:uncharacterized protein YceH (UPF0502 family)